MGKTMFAAALAALMLPAAAQADFKGYNKLLVFGDSLVDAGNAHYGALALGLDDPTDPLKGYVGNRFSNGGNFADYLNVAINGAPSSSYLPTKLGNNYGVGGADAAYSPTEVSPSFLPQLSLFQATKQPLTPDTLVLVTFGGNDVRDVLLDTGPVDFTPTLTAMAVGLQALIKGGATGIVVTGLPDIGLLPKTAIDAAGNPIISPLATARSLALNTAFANLVAQIDATTGANVQFFDLLTYEHSLIADPAAFGLPATLDTTSFCQAGGYVAVVVQKCAGYLYFDPIHPTTQVHATIAAAIGAELLQAVPEPASWMMMVAGFGLAGTALRRERRSVRVGFAAAD